MAYRDFTLDAVHKVLGCAIQEGSLFERVDPVEVPPWLQEALDKGKQLAFISEKSRSEFIVAPILLTARDLSRDWVSIYSGQRLDVNPDLGLVGECDFILTRTPPVPFLQAPVMPVVEAKKNDIEGGLGQCAAQMVGAAQFNLNEKVNVPAVFGCVTTGEAGQFLRLTERSLTIDRDRFYINRVSAILGMLKAIIDYGEPGSAAA